MFKGITVIEVSTLIAGPYCAMLLGDMGADVIKVEHPVLGDTSREMGPPFIQDQATFYLCPNRSKKGLGLDIGKKRGWEILMKLVENADVFIQNVRPDIAEKWKIDYHSIQSVKKDIIYCLITGFGEDGPYRMKPASDTIFQGMGGAMMVSGEEGTPPMRLGITPADTAAGIYAALGVVSALFHRQRTGEGQQVACSLIDSLMALQGNRITEYLATGKNPLRTGKASPLGAPIEFFETKDDYINISVFRHKFWEKLCSTLDIEKIAEDPRFKNNEQRMANVEALREILSPIFKQKTTDAWREVLDKQDIPNGPIYTYSEMLADRQFIQNQMVVEVDHPTLGPTKLVNQPIRYSKTPAQPKSHPPLLGEHTAEILKSLGIPDEEMAELRKQKVVN